MAVSRNVSAISVIAIMAWWCAIGGKAVIGYCYGIKPGMVRYMVTQDGRERVEVVRWDAPNGYVYYRVPSGAIYGVYPDFFINATGGYW
jgi:hypothetical protein